MEVQTMNKTAVTGLVTGLIVGLMSDILSSKMGVEL